MPKVFVKSVRPTDEAIMRLRICVQRHELPPVKLVIKAPDEQPTPISKLLEHINILVPLESEWWGLEDYCVTLGEYECLHYIDLHSILDDNDELSIRALHTNDIKARIASGRMQISSNGIHLLDGIPFGRQVIRRPQRPGVYIPPLKRRRLTEDDHTDVLADDEEVLAPGFQAHNRQARITAGLSDLDEGAETEEVGDDIEKEVIDHTVEHQDPQQLQGTRVRRGARRSSVKFVEAIMEPPSQHDDYWSAEEDSETDDSDFAAEESEDDTSEPSDDMDDTEKRKGIKTIGTAPKQPRTKHILAPSPKSSPSTSSPSASSASSESLSENEESIHNRVVGDKTSGEASCSKPITEEPAHARSLPGQGKKGTKERNKRRKARKRLDYLKDTGKLHGEATMSDLKLFEAEERGDIPSKFEVYGRFEANNVDPSPDTAAAVPTTGIEQSNAANGLALSNPATGVEAYERLLQLASEDPTQTSMVSYSDSEAPEELASKKVQKNIGSETLSKGSAPRLSRLDVASSRRLLFGSLGVRAPRSKEEEDKLRAKLGDNTTGRVGANGARKAITPDNQAIAYPEDDHDLGDAWQSRINMTAVECVEEGVVLSAPPFPFRQRWDPQQQLRGKKRKRLSQVPREVLQEEEEDEEEEWTGLDYDDPMPTDLSSHAKQGSPELPDLPTDLTCYPRVTRSDCKSGAIIAFTNLEVSKITNWQPGITPLRTARIDSFEDEVLILSLAKRDRSQAQYDERGRRVYDKHEMPAEDNDEDGTIEVAFEELAEAYVLRNADGDRAASMVPDSVPPDAMAEASDSDSARYAVGHGKSHLQSHSEESQELQAAQHQMPATSASEDSNKLIEASA